MTVVVTGAEKTYRARLSKRGLDEVRALDGADLDAGETELVVVVGPSGSGKTTLLRCIAGLETLDAGRVDVGGRDVTNALPGERDVAMVFQEYALYPHLTAKENIAFGLRARKEDSSVIGPRVAEAASKLGLEGALDRRPGELSGGERQRVALARALVRQPRAFLMDEPLSNLDAELRARTRADIRALQRELATTMIYVTHDQTEAMTMGDRVVVLRAGRVEQVAPPMELYDRPTNVFVAGFLGSPAMNLFPASLLGRVDGATTLGLRPERIGLSDLQGARVSGRVVAIEPHGSETIAHIEAAGEQRLMVRVGPSVNPPIGSEVGLLFEDADVHAFDSEGRALQ